MNKYIANALGLTAIAALASFAWALLQWSQAGAAVTASAGHLDSVLAQADVALKTINRPCASEADKAAHKDAPCGTLADVDKAVVHLSDITVAVQKQANDSGRLMQHASATLDGIAFDAQNELDDLKATTTEATGLIGDGRQVMVQVNTDLRTLNDSLAAVKPVIDHADAVVDHVDVAVNSMTPDAQRLVKNSADGMGELAGMAGDGHKMTAHLERDFDAKQAWWKKAFPMAEDAGKFYTCITTHVCVN